MIVHLNGMPGVGKLTVARRLRDMLPARLIDNHLLIDLVESICGGRSPDFQAVLATVTEVVHRLIAEQRGDSVLVFTNALAAGLPEDEARLAAVRALAERMGRPFVPVLLTCDAAENERRLLMPDRAAKRKLMDAKQLHSLIANYEISHDRGHPHALEIDTTALTAEQTAERIAAHVKSVRGTQTGSGG